MQLLLQENQAIWSISLPDELYALNPIKHVILPHPPLSSGEGRVSYLSGQHGSRIPVYNHCYRDLFEEWPCHVDDNVLPYLTAFLWTFVVVSFIANYFFKPHIWIWNQWWCVIMFLNYLFSTNLFFLLLLLFLLLPKHQTTKLNIRLT